MTKALLLLCVTTLFLVTTCDSRPAFFQAPEQKSLVASSQEDDRILEYLFELREVQNEAGTSVIKAITDAEATLRKLDMLGTRLNCAVINLRDEEVLQAVIREYQGLVRATEILLDAEVGLPEYLQIVSPEDLRAQIAGHKIGRILFSQNLLYLEGRIQACGKDRHLAPSSPFRSRPERTASLCYSHVMHICMHQSKFQIKPVLGSGRSDLGERSCG